MRLDMFQYVSKRTNISKTTHNRRELPKTTNFDKFAKYHILSHCRSSAQKNRAYLKEKAKKAWGRCPRSASLHSPTRWRRGGRPLENVSGSRNFE